MFVNRAVTGVCSVTTDQSVVVQLALDHRRSLGHRHVAWLNEPSSYWSAEQRGEVIAALDRRHTRHTVISNVEPTFDGGWKVTEDVRQGDTNQWTPNLVRDHHYVDPPRSPAEGYHLTEDLADTAIRYIADQQQATPGKPFLLYFATGATHAPHHVPGSWVEPYAGRYDDGWDRWRQQAFARQRAEGIVPDTAVLTERPSWVPAWDDLDGDARRLFARMRENYAGFLSHTDAQIGRVVTFLDEIGQLDNTVIVAIADNGASAEGGVIGTFNEHRFTQRTVETVEGNLAHADEWGGFRTYPHYPWGWAWAGNTPFRRWKRYVWLGGTRVPLIVHWPRRVTAGGEVRGQLCHVVDLMPTILAACGVAAPDVLDGVTQQPIDGAPMQATFDDPEAASPRQVQYFEMSGSRAIIAGEWKATTDHVSQGVLDEENLMEGSRSFTDDRWSLFHLEDDFSEATDVADANPDVLRQLQELWFAEAGRHGVLPISDSLTDRLGASIGLAYPPAPRSVFRPGASPVSDEAVPSLTAGGRITAVVDVPDEGAQGVLCAMGDWTSGFALYVVDGRLVVHRQHRSRSGHDRRRRAARRRDACRCPAPWWWRATRVSPSSSATTTAWSAQEPDRSGCPSPGSTAAPHCASATTAASPCATTTAAPSRGPGPFTRWSSRCLRR